MNLDLAIKNIVSAPKFVFGLVYEPVLATLTPEAKKLVYAAMRVRQGMMLPRGETPEHIAEFSALWSYAVFIAAAGWDEKIEVPVLGRAWLDSSERVSNVISALSTEHRHGSLLGEIIVRAESLLNPASVEISEPVAFENVIKLTTEELSLEDFLTWLKDNANDELPSYLRIDEGLFINIDTMSDYMAAQNIKTPVKLESAVYRHKMVEDLRRLQGYIIPIDHLIVPFTFLPITTEYFKEAA